MRAVLALDQGGHASRACLVGEHGRILATHAVPIDTIHGPDGEVEHDADAIVESLRAAARGVLGAVGATTTDNAALATQRSTIVCFERSSGRALSPAISWQDRRNAAWLASFGAHAERIRALTGLPLSPHYGVGKMRWCLDHLPAVRRAADRGELVMAPLASYLAMRLTVGDPLADPANASRTLLWDAQQRDWSSELLALFGIERAWLPRCTATRSDFGSLQLDDGAAQAQAGAAPRAPRPAIVLRAVTGDQSAVPFASGTADPATIYINLGTGAFVQRPLAVRPTSVAPLLASVLLADANGALYSVEGTVNGAGSAIAQFAGGSGLDEASLWQQLEQLPANAALPLYINGIGGLGSPYWRAQQPSYFLGDGSVLERFAAVVESIAFLIAINVDGMRLHGGPPTRVLITGGLSRSDWLCRRLSALLSLPVLRGAQEATVLGTAALVAPDTSAVVAAPATLATPGASASDLAALAVRRLRFEAALANLPDPAGGGRA
jgi:glycerol kinase